LNLKTAKNLLAVFFVYLLPLVGRAITFWGHFLIPRTTPHLNRMDNHEKTSIARQTVKLFEIFPYRNPGLFISNMRFPSAQLAYLPSAVRMLFWNYNFSPTQRVYGLNAKINAQERYFLPIR